MFMPDSETSPLNARERPWLDVMAAFWPVIVCPAVSLSTLHFSPWAGVMIGLVVLLLRRLWWTCIFGLLVTCVIVASMIASGFAWWKLM
jgi:hypothetical protein